MANKTNVEFFQSDDVLLQFAILNASQTLAVDVSTWSISFMLKRVLRDLDVAKLLEKTTASGDVFLVGTFDPDPTVNTQRVRVKVNAADLATIEPGVCKYELKRMDASFEAVLAYGNATLIRSVHRQ